MAVIITNMDMPLTCEKCEYSKCGLYKTSWYIVGNDSLNYTTKRHKNCPLKSTDEMKQELFNCLFDNSDIDIGLAEIGEVEAIIDKYCDKENKDGNSKTQ